MKKISEISKIYFCENCNYNCSKQSEWSKHLLTSKHENRTNVEQKISKISKISKNSFQCRYCQKSYAARNSVWYHEQKCKHNEQCEDDDNSSQENVLLSNLILEVVKQNKELMKENGEFKDMMLEQNKLVLEIAKKNISRHTEDLDKTNQ